MVQLDGNIELTQHGPKNILVFAKFMRLKQEI